MKISIITASFNSGKTITDTLMSVKNQYYDNYEHIIIDGKSTDNTLEIIRNFDNPKIRLISESDTGIYDAMNKGLNLASGEVIGFLNSDDFYSDPNVLDKFSAAFQDHSVEVCYSDLVYVTLDKSKIVRYWKSKNFSSGDFANGWCPAHPTFYVRRSAFERLGYFDLSFKLAADADFMMRYLEFGGVKSVYIPHVLVNMRLGGATNGSWSNIIRQNIEIFSAMKKNNVSFNFFPFMVKKIFSRIKQFAKM